MNKLRWTN